MISAWQDRECCPECGEWLSDEGYDAHADACFVGDLRRALASVQRARDAVRRDDLTATCLAIAAAEQQIENAIRRVKCG